MANITIYTSRDFTTQDDFFDGNSAKILSETSSSVTLISTQNTLQTYSGNNFTFDSDGTYTGGTLTGIIEQTADGFHLLTSLTGVSIPVSVINSFADQNDTLGIQRYILSGNDSITGSNQNDTIFGYAGNDTIVTNGGNDLINGNQGNDFITGGAGNSTLFGGQGSDTIHAGSGLSNVNGNKGNDVIYADTGNSTLAGGQGDDTIHGGSGINVLIGAKGNDFLYSGTGATQFVYDGSDSGQDIISGFKSGDAIDIVSHINGTNIATFADVAARMTSSAGNTIIDLGGGNNITLIGIAPTDLHSSEFIFL